MLQESRLTAQLPRVLLLGLVLFPLLVHGITKGYEPVADDMRFDAVGALGSVNNLNSHNSVGNATLIASNVVLVAKHTLPGTPPAAGVYAVRFRRHTDGSVGSKMAGVASYHQVTISSYVYGSGDIALAYLSTPVTHIRPIKPLYHQEELDVYDFGLACGWGMIGPEFEEGEKGGVLHLGVAGLSKVEDWWVAHDASGVNMNDSGGAILCMDPDGELRFVATIHTTVSAETAWGVLPWDPECANPLPIPEWVDPVVSIPPLPTEVSIPTQSWALAGMSTGLWENAGNWDGGVPTSTVYADTHVDNGGTVMVEADDYAIATKLYVGYRDNGTVLQSGGTSTLWNAANGRGEGLYMGFYEGATGLFVLNDGMHQSPFTLIGNGGGGVFTQHGGTNTVYNDIWLGGQPTGTGTYVKTGGRLTSSFLFVGYRGDGTFQQSGGDTYSTRTEVGVLPGASGHISLSGGTLTAGWPGQMQTIGVCGEGDFLHQGGVNSVLGSLVLGEHAGASGRYTVSSVGAELTAGYLTVGAAGRGEFTLETENDIGISIRLSIGTNGWFSAPLGGRFTFAQNDPYPADGTSNGVSMDILNPVQVADLDKMEFLFNGNFEGNFEVCGYDTGAFAEGFVTNFAIGTLSVQGPLRLIDCVDNQPAHVGAEVLYAHTVKIQSGGTLNLNGITIYCESYINSGGSVQLNGGQIVVLEAEPVEPPEPEIINLVDWRWRMPLVCSGYAGTEPLTNFPALVQFVDGVNGFSYTNFSASATGGDLRFSDATGTNSLVFEIDTWNTNGVSAVWVQIPVLTNGTTLYALWGNDAETAFPFASSNGYTWSESYDAVFHCSEGAGTEVSDSTPLTAESGTMTGAQWTPDGCIGNAVQFNGGTSARVENDISSRTYSSGYTVGLWAKAANVNQTAFAGLFNSGAGSTTAGQGGFQLAVGTATAENTENAYVYWASAVAKITDITTEWVYITARRRSDGTDVETFCNGVPAGSVADARLTFTRFDIGINRGRGASFNGIIDEVRVSTVARSDDWIGADYMNMASNAVFWTFEDAVDRDSQLLEVRYDAGTGGWISGATSQWVSVGADAAGVTAMADAGAVFARWSDDVDTAARTDTNVTDALHVTATFISDDAGVPLDWYAQHELVPEAGQSWADLDTGDADTDGWLNWQEYVTVTSPTNATDHLPPLSIAMAGLGFEIVLVHSDTGRIYHIDMRTNLSSSAIWQSVTSAPGTGGGWSYTGSVDRTRFYRLRVSEP